MGYLWSSKEINIQVTDIQQLSSCVTFHDEMTDITNHAGNSSYILVLTILANWVAPWKKHLRYYLNGLLTTVSIPMLTDLIVWSMAYKNLILKCKISA